MFGLLLCNALLLASVRAGEYLYDGLYNSYNNEYASAYNNYKPRDYKFEYGVSDPHTGDHKSQWEVREHGVVRGQYSLLEPDGTTRVVDYYADDTGFHADVKKIGHSIHPEHQYVSPVAQAHIADNIAYNGYGHGGLQHSYGAPIAAIQHIAPVQIEQHVLSEPIHHVAPIAQVQHIAPVQQVIAPQLIEKYAPAHYNYENILKFAKTPEYIPELAYNQPELHYVQEAKPIPAPIAIEAPIVQKVVQPLHITPKVQQQIFQLPKFLQDLMHQFIIPQQPIIKQQQIIETSPVIKEQYIPQPEIYQQPIELKYPEPVLKESEHIHAHPPQFQIIAKEEPIPHYQRDEIYQHQEPIQLKAVPAPYYPELIHKHQQQVNIVPTQYVHEEPKYQQYQQVEQHQHQQYQPVEQYQQHQPIEQHQQYYQEYERPVQHVQSNGNHVAQIDEAILKYLSQPQPPQSNEQVQAPYYGLNHGN